MFQIQISSPHRVTNQFWTSGSSVTDRSNNFVDVGRVQMLYEKSNEAHLFARIVKHNLRVVRVTAKAVRCHHHRQIVRIHLCHGCDLRRRKFLSH